MNKHQQDDGQWGATDVVFDEREADYSGRDDVGQRRPTGRLARYELDDAPGGTLVAIHAVGTPGRFFGWATPVMARQVRKSISGDLGRLRAAPEN